jgi:hypothetical protein
MEPEDSLPHSQACPYPEPEVSLILHVPISQVPFPLLCCAKGSVQVRGLVKCLVTSHVLPWEIWKGSPCVGSGASDLGCEEVRFSLLDSKVDNSAPFSRDHWRQKKKLCSQRVTLCLQLRVLRRQLNTIHLPHFKLLIETKVICYLTIYKCFNKILSRIEIQKVLRWSQRLNLSHGNRGKHPT